MSYTTHHLTLINNGKTVEFNDEVIFQQYNRTCTKTAIKILFRLPYNKIGENRYAFLDRILPTLASHNGIRLINLKDNIDWPTLLHKYLETDIVTAMKYSMIDLFDRKGRLEERRQFFLEHEEDIKKIYNEKTYLNISNSLK